MTLCYSDAQNIYIGNIFGTVNNASITNNAPADLVGNPNRPDIVTLAARLNGSDPALGSSTGIRNISIGIISSLQTFRWAGPSGSPAFDTGITGSNRRLFIQVAGTPASSGINSQTVGGSSSENISGAAISPTVPTSITSSSSNVWVTVERDGMSACVFSYSSPTLYSFTTLGYARGSSLSTPLNTYALYVYNLGAGVQASANHTQGFRPQSTGGTNKINFLETDTSDANYTFTCQNGAIPSEDWVGTFWMIEDNIAQNNPALGYGNNVLFAKGAFTVGAPYRPIPVNSSGARVPGTPILGQVNDFLCVAEYAGGYLLMRTFTP